MTSHRRYQEDLREMLIDHAGFNFDHTTSAALRHQEPEVISLRHNDYYWRTPQQVQPSLPCSIPRLSPSPRTVFLSENREAPYLTVSLILGVMLALIAVLVGWKAGMDFLPLLAVYSAVGSAVTLATTVVLSQRGLKKPRTSKTQFSR